MILLVSTAFRREKTIGTIMTGTKQNLMGEDYWNDNDWDEEELA